MCNLKKYRDISYRLPSNTLAWRIYGKGMENFGDIKPDDKKAHGNRYPSAIPVLEPNEDEILVRSDAVGLCFSDTKIIKFGPDHPRLGGRNLKEQPVIPGHEVALTIIKAGKKWEKKYKPGEKYIIQADVYYRGKSVAYGYILPGGLSQYGIIGKEVLEGDKGSYLIPIRKKDLSYSQTALVEPWACVFAAYRIKHRNGIKPGGNLLIVGNGKDEKVWDFTNLFRECFPKSATFIRLGKKTTDILKRKFRDKDVAIKEEKVEFSRDQLTEGKGFDDVIILGNVGEETLTLAADSMCKYGIMNYMASDSRDRWVNIDAGKIHYDRILFIGSLENDVKKPYIENHKYSLRGESIFLLGAGGPMGQMHVHLAIEKNPPPHIVIATDIDTERINTLKNLFKNRAEQRGIGFYTINPREFGSNNEYRDHIININGEKLFDYVLCLAAIPEIIEEASSYLADRAILNIFAGVSIGTVVKLNLTDVVKKKVRWIGSSGSDIEDMEYTLKKVESEELNPNISVAGISGMNDVWRGMEAVRTGSFPGKIVVYPNIEHMDLITMGELKKRYPEVGALLGENDRWTKEAEEELLEKLLQLD